MSYKPRDVVYLKKRVKASAPTHGRVHVIRDKHVIIDPGGKKLYKALKKNVTTNKEEGWHHKELQKYMKKEEYKVGDSIKHRNIKTKRVKTSKISHVGKKHGQTVYHTDSGAVVYHSDLDESQLDELSQKTLRKYAKKAGDEARHLSEPGKGRLNINDKPTWKKYSNRVRGAAAAHAKAEVQRKKEKLDELSVKKLEKYARKASDHESHWRAVEKHGYESEKPHASEMRQKRRKGLVRAYDKIDKRVSPGRPTDTNPRVPASESYKLAEDAPTTATPGIAAIGGPNDSGEPGMSKVKQRRYTKANKKNKKRDRIPSFANFLKVIQNAGE